jgi:hypothetical protein
MALFSQTTKDASNMQLDSDNLLMGVLAFMGTILVGAVSKLWMKVSGQETRNALLEAARLHHQAQRQEDRTDRADARKALETQIDLHHKVMIEKVDGINHRVERLEKVVKNGH